MELSNLGQGHMTSAADCGAPKGRRGLHDTHLPSGHGVCAACQTLPSGHDCRAAARPGRRAITGTGWWAFGDGRVPSWGQAVSLESTSRVPAGTAIAYGLWSTPLSRWKLRGAARLV
jgi:hypothetical protein